MLNHGHSNPIDVLHSNQKVDRSQWRKKVLDNNPQINNLCERIYPIDRGVQFALHFHPGKQEIKQKLDKTAMVQLILQHLSTMGLKQTRQTLEKESKVSFPNTEALSNESRLVTYINNALRDTERIYDLSMEHTEYSSEEKQAKFAEREEILYQMGLLEDEHQDDGVNIWEEPAENIFIDNIRNEEDDIEEEVVKSGSLNKLVEHLTHDSKVDLQFLKTFLMTYQSFCTPEILMAKLIQRFNVPSSVSESSTRTIQIRVINVLKKWVDEYSSDFNEKLSLQLRGFIEQLSAKYPGPASGILKSLNRIFEESNNTENNKQTTIFNERTPEPNVPKNIFSNNLQIYDIDEEEIARQLTLIEFNLYKKIKPPELLNQSWNKAKLKHRAQNVLRIIDRFNSVSMWVATLIIQTPKVKARARMMARFMRIAEHLKTLNNYNSLMAIIAGLNFSSVYRLKYTREEVSAQTLRSYQELEKIMNSEGSFKIYRQRLQQGGGGPCLPYLGVHLTDLTFMDENPDMVPVQVAENRTADLINFTKRTLVFKVISLVQQYQQLAYNLQPVHQIQEFLFNIKSDFKAQGLELYQQELYRESLRREPKRAQRSDIQ